jgi:CubicO group peptidase (beta-lactamase class C family)
MEKFKIRVPAASLPYSVAITSLSNGTSLYTASNINNAEFEIPDAVSNTLPGFKLTVVDNLGKVASQEVDSATYALLKKYHVGPSIANGNFDNHLNAISNAASRGLTYAGVCYGRDDILDDAAFNQLDSITFDHTVAPQGGVYQKGFDRVVREAYLTNTGSLDGRISLRVGIYIAFENIGLNNGTTRTQFYGTDALSKRPDGVTPIYIQVDGPVPSMMNPSYASTEFRNFTKNFLLKFMKRYLPAINDGTIMSIGLLTGATGEAEYPVSERNADNTYNVYSRGDFHSEMVASFKTKFPAHNGASNNDIANADMTNSDLGRRWTWHLADEMRRFEWMMIDHITANIPGLTRRKWFQIDCGSFTDGMASRRRTFNLYERIHPKTMLVKCNDDSMYSNARHKWIADHLTSASRKYGCLAIIEPSPTGGDFGDPINRAYVKTQIDTCTAAGIGISFVTSNYSDIDWMISTCGLNNIDIPAYKNEFRTVNGNKVLNKYTYNLSQLYNINDITESMNGYESYISSIGATRADFQFVDDVKSQAAGQPPPTPTPTPSPTTVNFSSVTNFIDSNAASWGNEVLFDIKKNTGTIYSKTVGSTYNRGQSLEVMSLTKSVTAAVVLTVLQDGLFANGINTTVGSLIPSWNSGARATITLKHIMAHTSGIPDNQTNEGASTLEAYVDWLAGSALEYTPGTNFAYRTVSYQVAARMCEIVTGKQWKVLWKERIRDTCGMGTAEYNPDGELQPVTGNPNNPLAGYKLFCTQTEYMNFMGMLRDGGVYGGNTILNSTSLNLMFTDQTGGLGNWGFGMIRNDIISGVSNEPTSESAKGCYAWINVNKGYAAVLFTQHNYESSIGANGSLRDLVRSIL